MVRSAIVRSVLVTLVAVAAFLASGSAAFSEDAPTDPPITEEPTTTTTSTSTTSSTTTTTTAPESVPVDVPQNATAALTVTPNTGLLHFQSVTVDGTGYTANSFALLRQCSGGSTTDDECDTSYETYTATDGSGVFSKSFIVQRLLVTPNATVDCASASGACEIRVIDGDDASNEAAAPLEFDAGPPLPSKTLTVTPSTMLLNNQTVTVDGSGFFPDSLVGLKLCTPDSTPIVLSKCAQGVIAIVNADANGDFTTSLTVRRVIVYQTQRIDCANVIDLCVVTATEFYDFTAFAAVADVTFDASVPLPPPPVLILDPDAPVHDGQRVLVRGAGYTPGATVGYAQCGAGVTDDGALCEVSPDGSTAAVDANGFVTIRLRVKAVMHTPSGVIDCTVRPGACIVGAGNLDDPNGEGTGVELTFAEVAGSLANTGAPVDTLIKFGAAMLLAGLSLLLLTRSARGRTSLGTPGW